MLKHIITIIFIYPLFSIYSQVYIDFENDSLSDWEESVPEHWEISTLNSISENFSIHHAFDNTTSGNDQIALPIAHLDLTRSVTWKFKIRHGYNPSSSNNWSVFLFSDGSSKQMTPENSCYAYVLGINFKGSDDFLKVWKKSATENIELFNTDFNWQDNVSTSNHVDFDVGFLPPDKWAICFSISGEENKTFQFEFLSKPHIQLAQYFGVYYKYSSSQDLKLWFDDLVIEGNFLVDTVSPIISSINIQQNIIDLIFSEAIRQKSIDRKFISISPKIDFNINSKSATRISLELENSLEIDKDYALSLKNITDLSGNTIKDTTQVVQYSIAKQNDIVISEIMTDPFPAISLPEQEFIELFNRTTKTFNLTNYSIWVGDKQQIIQSGNILPGEYIIICDDSDIEDFSDWGKVIDVKSLPNLTKSSGTIMLRNNLGQMIHQLNYNDDVYLSKVKLSGGWTLEMIDPDNPCHFENNWGESNDESGGTPGRQNSVIGDNKDIESPAVKNISMINDTSIRITFNELIDSLFTSQHLTFSMNEITNFSMLDFKNLEANLLQPVLSRKLYELTLTGVRDCAANEIDKTIYYPFAKTEEPDSLDIVFNEIMFDPESNYPEYIEIVNASDKFLDLRNLFLLKQKSILEFDTIPVATISTLFLPEQLAVLSKSNEVIFNNYSINQNSVYIEMEKFPSLTNASGIFAMQNSLGKIIDIFEYTEAMHFDLLHETKGVALEKINVENSSLDRNNWQSASASENYATPGWPNSQMLNYNSTSYTPFTIEPEVFSPNYDGYNDELRIKYHFNETGIVLNLKIFDAKGRLINQLANNFLCGTQGEFVWKGEKFDDEYALNGIYLIYIEYFDLEGNINVKKATCVLAR